MACNTPELCACVLFYGEDDVALPLAQRVLNGPMRELAKQNVEFRFGFNAVGEKTRAYVREAVESDFQRHLWIEPEGNIFKYPIMRRMLYDAPLLAPLTMWFDDDSCLAPDCNVASWWPRVKNLLDTYAMVGSLYKQRLVGDQLKWIKDQWWYNNRPLPPYVKFITGGWWTIRTSVLMRFNWPLPELRHRGGDVMLGALCAQHDIPITHFRDQVWINANAQGVESKAPRRGFNEKPVGFQYRPGASLPGNAPRPG